MTEKVEYEFAKYNLVEKNVRDEFYHKIYELIDTVFEPMTYDLENGEISMHVLDASICVNKERGFVAAVVIARRSEDSIKIKEAVSELEKKTGYKLEEIK